LYLLGMAFYTTTLIGQTVTLSNLSHSYTHLEVGNVVRVQITGAAPFGTVTVVQNGNAPYTFGQTDGNGNWSTTSTETSDYVGSYNQVWYVNGVALSPNNPNTTYLPYAPTLPAFTVYANFTGTSCPVQSTQSAGCGASNNARHWIWSPVTYSSSCAVFTSAITSWNGIQGRISLSSDSSVRQDISISDDSGLPGYSGITYSYGEDCGGCYNLIDQCTGTF
jgi:hypothetical protein